MVYCGLLAIPLAWVMPRKRSRRFLSWLACSPVVREYRLLTLAGVVVRIDVVELKRRLSVDLHYGFSGGHGVVVHVGVEEGKAAGNKDFHLAGVKLIAHADFERPG